MYYKNLSWLVWFSPLVIFFLVQSQNLTACMPLSVCVTVICFIASLLSGKLLNVIQNTPWTQQKGGQEKKNTSKLRVEIHKRRPGKHSWTESNYWGRGSKIKHKTDKTRDYQNKTGSNWTWKQEHRPDAKTKKGNKQWDKTCVIQETGKTERLTNEN